MYELQLSVKDAFAGSLSKALNIYM